MRISHYIAAVILSGSVLGVAQGVTFSGSATGSFGTPDPAENNTGVGTNEVRFGDVANPNVLRLDGQSFSAEDDAPFAVSGLTYTNGLSNFGSVSIPANVTMDFSSPTGLSRTFNFTFQLTATDNLTGDPVVDADTLVVSNAISSTTFTVDGQELTLKLLGFSTDSGQTLTTSFTLPENQTVQSQLIGQITAPEPGGPGAPIPEPATVALWVLGVGLLTAKKWRRA